MTDLQKFIDLYRSLGIELKIDPKKNGSFAGGISLESGFQVELYAGAQDKLVGYDDFNSTIIFDANGNFVNQGFWEG